MDNHRPDDKENIIREAVKAELQGMEVNPPPEAWEKISSRLEKAGSAPRTGRNPASWYRYLGLAASFLILIGGGMWFTQNFLPRAQDDLSPEMTEAGREAKDGSDDFGILDFDPAPDSAHEEADTYSILTPEADYAPPEINGYQSGQVIEINDPLHAVFHLYEGEAKEIWFVGADIPHDFAGDFPGMDGRFIPSEKMTDLNRNTINFVRDNVKNQVLLWFYGDRVFMLWPKSDNIRYNELKELRANWP